jgi:hypothetical protein
MADNQINIGITVSGNANVELKKLDKGVDELQKSMKDTGKSFTSAFNVFKGTFGAGVALQAFNAIGRSVKAFAKTLLVDSVAAAQAQEDAEARLNQSLRETGEFSAEAAQGVRDFAAALQESTTAGDEAILEGVALANSFTKNIEKAKELTAAALDFAEGADINFTEAIRRLGRATQGSTDDIAKFAPAIRGLTREQLAAGEATRILAAQFRGAASAASQTFSGALQQTGNIFSDFQESIGRLITDNPAFVGALKEVSEILKELTVLVNENSTEIKEGLVQAFLFAIDAAQLFLGILQPIEIGLRSLLSTAVLLQDPLNNAGKAFAILSDTTFATKISDALERIKVKAQEFGASMSEASETAISILGSGVSTALLGQQTVLQGEIENNEKLTEERAKQIALIQEENGFLRTIDEQANADKIANNQLAIDQILAQEEAGSRLRLKVTASRVQKERALEAKRLGATSQLFGDLASLQQTGNAQLFELGKVFAISQAIVNVAQGVTKALSLGPILGPAAAAAIAVKGGVQIATISAQKLAKGIDEVPPGFPADTFPAALTSGERVVPAESNQDLKAFLSDSEGLLPVLQSIDAKLSGQMRPVTVQIGGREIISEINDEIESGRALAV